MGNINKPFPIELIERSIWRAVIEIAVGVDVQTAVLKIVNDWESPEMRTALANDDRAPMWFRNLRGTSTVKLYLCLILIYYKDPNVQSASTEKPLEHQASNATPDDSDSDEADTNNVTTEDPHHADIIYNIRQQIPTASDEQVQNIYEGLVAQFKRSQSTPAETRVPHTSTPLRGASTSNMPDPNHSSHHDIQQTASDSARTHTVSPLLSSRPSSNPQSCPLCNSKPWHALDNCPLTKNGADALASIIVRLELENKSETLISNLKEIWKRITNEGKSHPMVHKYSTDTSTKISAHKYGQSKSIQRTFRDQY